MTRVLLQVFPKDQPGIYINKLKLGPVQADLTAKYKYVGSERIDVNFVDIAAYLGSVRLFQKVHCADSDLDNCVLRYIRNRFDTPFAAHMILAAEVGIGS